MNNTLYKITILSGTSYLVIADDAQLAYDRVRNYLDNNDIEFSSKRELASIEVIANQVEENINIYKEI